MRMVHRKVLINTLPEDTETVYKGLIKLPDSARGFSNHGVIESIGPDVTTVIPGEWVLLNRKFAHKLPEDEQRVIIDERYLIAVMALESEVRISVAFITSFAEDHTAAHFEEAMQRAGVVVNACSPFTTANEAMKRILKSEATVCLVPSSSRSFYVGFAYANNKPVFASRASTMLCTEVPGIIPFSGEEELIKLLKNTLRKDCE